MSDYGLSAENFMRSLPSVLANDENLNALAMSVAEALEIQAGQIDNILIYQNIDTMPEDLLDILAKDFKIDWWDANLPITEKRNLLRTGWSMHRILGTKGAVIVAISSVYGNAHVEEWFEYNGQPYHFRIVVDSDETIADGDKLLSVLEKIIYYKNLRSVLDETRFELTEEFPMRYVGRAVYASNYTSLTIDTVIDPSDYNWLTDENNVMLINDEGNVLTV